VYDRHFTDCLSVQADVAARIARSLAVELLPEQPLRPSHHVGAYQAYLKGRYYSNKPGDEGLDQAIFYFDQARESDPEFAAAYADLARARTAQAEYYTAVPRDVLGRAREDALRALKLDPHLSNAHLAHANIVRMLDWDWVAAEEGYRQAIALNPSSEGAHRWYGSLLLALGRHSEALREGQRAVELDPLCLVVGNSVAWSHYVVGDYEAAIGVCRHVLGMDPRFLRSRRVLAAALLQLGRSAEAVAELESAATGAPEDPVLLCWLAHAKAVRGDCAVASVLLQAVERMRERRFVPAYHLALAHMGLDRKDDVFNLLDRACEERDPALLNVALDHRFEPLRDDARFTKVLERLRLPAMSFPWIHR
jgi:tetratricopeptide (TPR) repeat protein